jgi:hypothetical protein
MQHPDTRTMQPIALLLLAAVSAFQGGRGAQSLESVVQAAVIDSLFVRDTTRQIVVGDSTVSGGTHFVDEDYTSALRSLGPLPEGVQEDFEAKRGTVRRVDSLSTKVPMRRFTATDRAGLRGQGSPTSYWNAFYRRFPGSPGLVAISRVGFGRDGASALVLVEYGCGGLCGGTIYVLLAQQSGRWRVTRTAQPRIA